ncbi:MAG: MarC family protein [Rhodothalassiaceae bacterium]
MEDAFIAAFVTFFVVIDPIGIAPLFASLSRDGEPAWRRRMAFRGTLIATLVLLFFALVGEPFLRALGISLDALKVSGGVMLFLIAIEMVFEKRTERRENAAERTQREHAEDISVFPIAIPLLAGPGAIASIILLMADHRGDRMTEAAVLAALLINLFLTLLAFLAAGRLMALIGQTVSAIISRVLGIVLAALAAQFILDGVRSFFA